MKKLCKWCGDHMIVCGKCRWKKVRDKQKRKDRKWRSGEPHTS